jgi:YVTN family beta-propeller protein
MKNSRIFLFALLAAMLFTIASCDDEDNTPKGAYEDGVFVVNEGNFLHADGSVTFINRSSGEVTNDLFGAVNAGRALGDVVQSMTVAGDFAYVVVNNSNKMEVVNANTFEASYTLSDLKLPRYFTTIGNKGYITEWVGFSSGQKGRVSVVDLDSHTITSNVVTDAGAENIVEAGGKLFVSNNFTNTVSVINPSTLQVVQTLEVGDSPGAFVKDSQNKLWVICGGGSDANYNPLNNGRLVQIDVASNTVSKTIELNTNVSDNVAINKAGNQLFYFKGKSVYRINTTDTAAPSAPLLTEATAVSFYSIGIDPETDILYVADPKAFQANGTVYTYSTAGEARGTFSVGIGPNNFVFK